MRFSKSLFSFIFVVSSAVPVLADWPVGLWQSAPDRAGLVVHVRTKPCGSAICGRGERAKDRFGYDRPSSVVGRRMLLDMLAQPDGSFVGLVWEPQRNRILNARMQVTGNVMRFENCDGTACVREEWTRVR